MGTARETGRGARSAFLAEAGLALAEPMDCDSILEALVGLVVPRIADWCALEILVEVAGRGPCAAVIHGDPAKLELASELARRYPPIGTMPLPVEEVVRTGRPVAYFRISHSLLVRHARDSEQVRIVEALGISSALVVPVAAQGATFGALSIASERPSRRYQRGDRTLVEGLASRAGLALMHAQLYHEALEGIGARDQLLAIVAHDLRNALSVVLLRSSHLERSLRRGASRSTALADLEAIRRSAEQMDHLIRDLLDSSSAHSGALAIQPERQDLSRLVGQVLETMRPLFGRKGVHLRSDRAAEPIVVACDRDRIGQVLSNVVGNAVKFTPAGGLVTVRVRRLGGEAEVAVSDTGPGIPETHLRRIFDRYYQADRRALGTGLGLFISRAIVDAHGGRIWAQSRPGEGATICFRIPMMV